MCVTEIMTQNIRYDGRKTHRTGSKVNIEYKLGRTERGVVTKYFVMTFDCHNHLTMCILSIQIHVNFIDS